MHLHNKFELILLRFESAVLPRKILVAAEGRQKTYHVLRLRDIYVEMRTIHSLCNYLKYLLTKFELVWT